MSDVAQALLPVPEVTHWNIGDRQECLSQVAKEKKR
jgi:hypothetical protein